MKVALCTLVLNEMEWLPKLYEQHKDWPNIERWIFVESADRVYAQSNPHLVSPEGLSTDGTTEFLNTLSRKDMRVTHIRHGFCGGSDRAQGKCEARNRYLEEMEDVAPSMFMVLDADEFYPKDFQVQITNIFRRKSPHFTAFVYRHREIWYPQYVRDLGLPLLNLEVSGGFWDIPYCRCWKWFHGLSYSQNHNTPHLGSLGLDKSMKRYDKVGDLPYFVHMGFASTVETRAAKNRYYEERGEKVDKKRSWYCESRSCFESWKPHDILPRGARVTPYDGLIPECFQ